MTRPTSDDPVDLSSALVPEVVHAGGVRHPDTGELLVFMEVEATDFLGRTEQTKLTLCFTVESAAQFALELALTGLEARSRR